MFKRVSACAFFAGLLLFMLALSGCGDNRIQIEQGKINVVASFFPLADLAEKIGGDRVHVINLVPAGVEPHEWTPKSKELSAISRAEVFVYNGAGFEGWTEKLLKKSGGGQKQVVVEASKGIPLVYTRAKADERSVDPHVWTSPKSALQIAANIYAGLIQADPEHRGTYDAHYRELTKKLRDLDEAYRTELDKRKLKRREIVVAHQSFAYLCRDYGLTQMAVMGLAPDAEPTAKDLRRIAEFVRAHDVTTIFFEQLVSGQMTKTLAHDLNLRTDTLNPLEGLTEQQVNAGADYLSEMRANLRKLVAALK
ncbi:MAG TPA: zinc ABC transporter substrate-binding protein [Bacilli bacterium]